LRVKNNEADNFKVMTMKSFKQ